MPRFPTDYSRTIIYVIKCKDDNITEEYIGSTTDFIKRKCCHKGACNNEKNKDYNLNYINTHLFLMGLACYILFFRTIWSSGPG
jgi:predicted GIY-YIG superfamily endonuclease